MKAILLAIVIAIAVSAGMAIMGDPGLSTTQLAAAAGVEDDTAADAQCTPAGDVSDLGLNEEQIAIARIGVAAAERAGVGDAGARIIIATGLVESGLRNLNHGHLDSLGWLQGRPSQGWENASDPVGSADDFFAAMTRIQGWESQVPGDVAQAVQRSAHPERYQQRMPEATAIVAALSGAECAPPASAELGLCPPSGMASEKGLQPAALRGLRCGREAFPAIDTILGVGERPIRSDHGSGRALDFMIPGWDGAEGNALGWEVARWFQAHADALNITYIIWDDRIWSVSRDAEGWRQYRYPGDPNTTNPTLLHRDHVHVSFE